MKEIGLWFMTGPNGPYMTLVNCMQQDWFWIGMMVLANTFVILGYFEFARRNYKAYKRSIMNEGDSDIARSYMSLIWVFIFCAFCGYAYPLISIVAPVKKAFVLITFVLAAVTWRMIVNANSVDFYNEIFKKK